MRLGPVAGDPATYFGFAESALRVETSTARDPVLILVGSGFGVISYCRPDGRFLHTLNTPAGFRRKLQDLGIDAASVNAPAVRTAT